MLYLYQTRSVLPSLLLLRPFQDRKEQAFFESPFLSVIKLYAIAFAPDMDSSAPNNLHSRIKTTSRSLVAS